MLRNNQWTGMIYTTYIISLWLYVWCTFYSHFEEYAHTHEKDIQQHDEAVGRYYDFILEFERQMCIAKYPVHHLVGTNIVCFGIPAHEREDIFFLILRDAFSEKCLCVWKND